MNISLTLFFAFLLGILPAIFWLLFWIRQDKTNPEPSRLIIKTFAFGVLSAIGAFFLQHIFNYFLHISDTQSILGYNFFYILCIIFVWALIEEVVKYIAAFKGGLRTDHNDEAIDPPVYLISAALGFAALENTLFILEPLLNGSLQLAVMTAQMRFIGSTLVHVASSGLLGMFIGYSLFFMRSIRKRYFGVGVILATLLHTLFNLFIITGEQNSFIGFLIIWLFIILLIVLFEYIKKIKVNRIQNVREKEKENTYRKTYRSDSSR